MELRQHIFYVAICTLSCKNSHTQNCVGGKKDKHQLCWGAVGQNISQLYTLPFQTLTTDICYVDVWCLIYNNIFCQCLNYVNIFVSIQYTDKSQSEMVSTGALFSRFKTTSAAQMGSRVFKGPRLKIGDRVGWIKWLAFCSNCKHILGYLLQSSKAHTQNSVNHKRSKR